MRTLLTLLLTISCSGLLAQSNITYTVDPDFSTGQTLRSKTSVFDIYPLEDGGFFLGGGFQLIFTNPDSPFNMGIAMITENGSVHPDWGNGSAGFARELFYHDGGYLYPSGETLVKLTEQGENWYLTFGEAWGDYYLIGEFGSGWENPYNVRWTWDVFILEDPSVLIGGAIATDTLQPGLFRHLMRLLPDGSHDVDFPIIEAMPQGLNTHISKIERASDGSWYVSGKFQGINGHISPHIAHLTPDFEVDTDFVSPFYYESICCGLHTEMKLLDSQGRLWFSGDRVRLEENPSDFLHLVRLLPDGSVDPDFLIGRVEANYPFGWSVPPTLVSKIIEPDLEEEIFFLSGVFSHYNDTAQPAITAINDFGYIQTNYFANQGSTVNSYDPDDPTDYDAPAIRALEYLQDGSLMVGGSFSDFMGEEHYSMVKLNQGVLSTSDQPNGEPSIRVYPNPADESFQLVISAPVYDRYSSAQEGSRSLSGVEVSRVEILDLSGRVLESFPWEGNNSTYDISALVQGAYLIQLTGEDGVVWVEKLVVK